MQRHIRLVHLGCGGPAGWGRGPGRGATTSAPACYVPGRRQAEPEQSDGEEDFYYTELDVGLDTLTDGLSSLTPDSPVASTPPAFPHLELPGLLHPLALPPPPVLSSAQPPQACHSDHSYQVGEVAGRSGGRVSGHTGGEQDPCCVPSQGCLAPPRPEPQPGTGRACEPALPSKHGANLRCVS